MALVLRKAVLPKNVLLLKCIKGRSLATSTANKKNPAALTSTVARRRSKNQQKYLPLGPVKIERAKRLDAARGCAGPAKIVSIRYCSSCPSLSGEPMRPRLPVRRHSRPRTLPVSRTVVASPYAALSLPPCRSEPISRTFSTSKRTYASCKCGCPCPMPCGPFGCGCGCGCLPPPCNQPPKCIQYMTGYYYYPYGWWFCGPYHVSGTCCPVAGSAPCPCPCGPCPKCCCCVCPATSTMGVVGGAAGLKDLAKGSIFPNKLPNAPSPPEPTKTNRSGISKFFPFSTTTAISPNVGSIPKMEMPSMSSTSCVRHHSTGGSWNDNINSSSFPVSRSAEHGFSKALPQYERAAVECPALQQPRVLLTREERDMPTVRPGAFSYASVPNYKSPYPQPLADLKSYEA